MPTEIKVTNPAPAKKPTIKTSPKCAPPTVRVCQKSFLPKALCPRLTPCVNRGTTLAYQGLVEVLYWARGCKQPGAILTPLDASHNG